MALNFKMEATATDTATVTAWPRHGHGHATLFAQNRKIYCKKIQNHFEYFSATLSQVWSNMMNWFEGICVKSLDCGSHLPAKRGRKLGTTLTLPFLCSLRHKTIKKITKGHTGHKLGVHRRSVPLRTQNMGTLTKIIWCNILIFNKRRT